MATLRCFFPACLITRTGLRFSAPGQNLRISREASRRLLDPPICALRVVELETGSRSLRASGAFEPEPYQGAPEPRRAMPRTSARPFLLGAVHDSGFSASLGISCSVSSSCGPRLGSCAARPANGREPPLARRQRTLNAPDGLAQPIDREPGDARLELRTPPRVAGTRRTRIGRCPGRARPAGRGLGRCRPNSRRCQSRHRFPHRAQPRRK
jgi:hypothetical protein